MFEKKTTNMVIYLVALSTKNPLKLSSKYLDALAIWTANC